MIQIPLPLANHSRGKNRLQHAWRQRQTTLQLRQHRGQVGTLRQTIGPAPLKGFNHWSGDPGLLSQLPQAEPLSLPTLLEHLPQLTQRRVA